MRGFLLGDYVYDKVCSPDSWAACNKGCATKVMSPGFPVHGNWQLCGLRQPQGWVLPTSAPFGTWYHCQSREVCVSSAEWGQNHPAQVLWALLHQGYARDPMAVAGDGMQ